VNIVTLFPDCRILHNILDNPVFLKDPFHSIPALLNGIDSKYHLSIRFRDPKLSTQFPPFGIHSGL
jgi:hypothetical protein